MIKMRYIIFVIIFVAGIGLVVDDKKEMPYDEYVLKEGDRFLGVQGFYTIEQIEGDSVEISSLNEKFKMSPGDFIVADVGIFVVNIKKNHVILQIYNVTAE